MWVENIRIWNIVKTIEEEKVVDLIYFEERRILVTFSPSFWWRLCTIWYHLNQVSFLLSHRETKMHISLHIFFHCNFSNKLDAISLNYLHFSPFERKRRKCRPNFYGKSSLLCIVIFHRQMHDGCKCKWQEASEMCYWSIFPPTCQ